ncbi:hypothetical protein BLA24_04390 [Streptomyces cinnamoneus]|uniref:Uncharacterized protein n=1 Tax=Streptomyces cinnamoneus TaxID=53446 RepID=A0A2G1XP20_STRCJ|nr:hypothetical protein BLA24_04390 [Streptomyces cinnamoneus]
MNSCQPEPATILLGRPRSPVLPRSSSKIGEQEPERLNEGDGVTCGALEGSAEGVDGAAEGLADGAGRLPSVVPLPGPVDGRVSSPGRPIGEGAAEGAAEAAGLPSAAGACSAAWAGEATSCDRGPREVRTAPGAASRATGPTAAMTAAVARVRRNFIDPLPEANDYAYMTGRSRERLWLTEKCRAPCERTHCRPAEGLRRDHGEGPRAGSAGACGRPRGP